MSAAATRAEKLGDRTDELTQPAGTGIPGNQEAPPVIEVAKVTGTSLASVSDYGMTPLMRAARDGQAGTIRALIDRGAEVNAKRSDGFNALALAAFFGHSQVVWLLLENGADLAATGRSETPPERWADARGFFEIGDTLREARLTKQVEVSGPNTGVIDESARFARPTENEKHQRAGDPSVAVEAAEIDETTVSETKLVMRPARAIEESIATKSESTVDILPNPNPEHAQQEPVRNRTQRAVKLLPEIEDPPPLLVPTFHPGWAFVARITSSRNNLVALILIVLLGGSGAVAFLFPQVRKTLEERRTAAVSDTTNLPTDPSNPVAASGTKVSVALETPAATATKSTSAYSANDIEEVRADHSAASPSQGESAVVFEKGQAIAAAGESESRAHPSSDNQVSNTSEDRHDSAATSASRSGTRARKQKAVSRPLNSKPQTPVDEQPKPAPLTVETSRSRGVLSTPDGSASEVPSSRSTPSSIISAKPKSKVIQWP